jgi:hypothetical protein
VEEIMGHNSPICSSVVEQRGQYQINGGSFRAKSCFVLLFQYLAPFFTISDNSSTNQDAKNEPDFNTDVT